MFPLRTLDWHWWAKLRAKAEVAKRIHVVSQHGPIKRVGKIEVTA